MKKKRLLCMVLLLVMVQFQTGFAQAQGAETMQAVRVGFFAFDG